MPTLSYLPHISFLLTFNFSPFYIPPINIHQTPRFLLITAQISKIFRGFAPRPLISPSCLHSTSPPYISFLSIFTRPQDFSSLPRKYQKFSWGLRPQSPDHLRYPSCLHSTMPPDPLINPSSNIQHLPLIYPSYRHSPDPKISSLIMLLEGCDKYMDKKTVLIRCRYFQMYMYV